MFTMKKIIFIITFLSHLVHAAPTVHHAVDPHKPRTKDVEKKEATVEMHYNNEDLVDIINEIAVLKGIPNILMPLGANTMTTKVTLDINRPLSPDEAWDQVLMLISMAGYSFILRDTLPAIVKNSKSVSKESIPLFVGDADKIPDNDERIRFLYYLSNIKVSDDIQSEIQTVLKEFLPAETASWQIDQKTNAILITEQASNIKAVMKIITAIDQITYQEKLEIIQLHYTATDTIARFFNENILKASNDAAARYKLKGKRGEATYFSEQIKIIPEARTNKMILLGKAQSVNRVKEFIFKYIDVELESGNSILHVYQLQYLDAATFAKTLQSIVDAEKLAGGGQSSAGGAKAGVDRFFEGVIVRADQPQGGPREQALGGNKLVIAAKNDDWKHIKKLIEQLDTPVPQVIIEILIADLTLNDLRQLGASFRNPAALPVPNPGVSIQAAEIGPVVLDINPTTSTAPINVAADLLAQTLKVAGSTTPVSQVALTDIASPGFPGSTVIEVNDANGRTWGLAQVFRMFNHTKILSHPHVIAINNKQAIIDIGEERLVPGEATATAAAPTVKQEPIKANTTVKITPRISNIANSVNLQVEVNVNEFESGAGNARVTRTMNTNSNVQDGDILALGGLIRLNTTTGVRQTPWISKVPILGWMFKKRANSNLKTSLTIFISPTIVQPRLRGGVSEYTKDYVELAKEYSQEAQLFDSLRDPITRFFFNTPDDAALTLDNFVAKDELQKDTIRELDQAEPTEAEKRRQFVINPKKTVQKNTSPDKKTKVAEQLEKPIIVGQKTSSDDAELKKMLEGVSNPLLTT